MTDINEFDSTINNELKKVETDISKLANMEYSEKLGAIKKIQTKLKSIGILIESYDLEINNLDKSEATKFTDSITQINHKFTKLKNELERHKSDQGAQQGLFENMTKAPTDLSKMTCI